MLRLLTISLQVVIFFLLLGAVIGVGSGDTGVVEKAVLVAGGLGLVWLAARVRDLGRPLST